MYYSDNRTRICVTVSLDVSCIMYSRYYQYYCIRARWCFHFQYSNHNIYCNFSIPSPASVPLSCPLPPLEPPLHFHGTTNIRLPWRPKPKRQSILKRKRKNQRSKSKTYFCASALCPTVDDRPDKERPTNDEAMELTASITANRVLFKLLRFSQKSHAAYFPLHRFLKPCCLGLLLCT